MRRRPVLPAPPARRPRLREAGAPGGRVGARPGAQGGRGDGRPAEGKPGAWGGRGCGETGAVGRPGDMARPGDIAIPGAWRGPGLRGHDKGEATVGARPGVRGGQETRGVWDLGRPETWGGRGCGRTAGLRRSGQSASKTKGERGRRRKRETGGDGLRMETHRPAGREGWAPRAAGGCASNQGRGWAQVFCGPAVPSAMALKTSLIHCASQVSSSAPAPNSAAAPLGGTTCCSSLGSFRRAIL